MAIDMFIKIDGIEGESQDAVHTNEIKLESMAWGAANTGSFADGTGGGAGKVSFSDLTCAKTLDKASPILYLSCSTGKHIPKAVLTVRKAGGKQEDYFKVTMSDVMISSVQDSGHAQGDIPMETFALNFAKIEFAYKPQLADGTLDAAITSGYDLKKSVNV